MNNLIIPSTASPSATTDTIDRGKEYFCSKIPFFHLLLKIQYLSRLIVPGPFVSASWIPQVFDPTLSLCKEYSPRP